MTRPPNPHPQDGELSPDSRAYVLSLRTVAAREAARDYANMDEQLFRARVGPAIDELLVEVRAIAIVDRSPTISKKQVAALLGIGITLGEGILRGLGALRS